MNQYSRFLSTLTIVFLVCTMASATKVMAQQPIWNAAGSLGTARSLHTATPLTNGKVLVVGGLNIISPCCTTTASAELFDPATGQWVATASPATPRGNHVAVRLANGKVLIASGNGSPFSAILTSAEIYDPNTGTWSPAGNLSVARQSPRATLLADGRVLVTGGFSSGGAIATAEIYDPAANTWSPAGTMNAARVIHTVTTLPNGKVLIAGGAGSNFQPIRPNSAELFDPATNTWTLTGELITPRLTHAAVLLMNGKVLISGGSPDSISLIASAELYDPATGQWTPTGNMTTQRVIHTLTLLPNGKALAAAGAAGSGGNNSTSAELYDPGTGQWSPTAALSTARSNHTATLLANGKVLIACGSGIGNQLTSAEIYDSAAAPFVGISAASYLPGGAPESIVAAFGSNLSAGTETAPGQPLPTTLSGVSVRVRDSVGVERPAPLFFVSSGQINYQIPAGTAAGSGLVTVIRGNNYVAGGAIEIAKVAPGIFSANADGQGVAAAVALRIKSDGTQIYEPISRFDTGQGRFVAMPIDLGPATDEVFLVVYGTGIKFRSTLSAVVAAIGGAGSEVLFADAAPGFVGLDQVNLRIPRSLIGRGDVNVTLTVEGRTSNSVIINVH